MKVLFWIIIALVAWLLQRNVRFAVSRYALEHGLAWLVTYVILLGGLAFLVLSLTFRLLDLISSSNDLESASPTPYVLRRLSTHHRLALKTPPEMKLTPQNVDIP